MPIALNIKLAGKEVEMVRAIQGGLGIGGTMEFYGIKSRRTFLRWLREHTNGEWQPSPLTELKGGEKHKWLAEHRETILDCLEIFGRERTRDMFCLTKDDTLERFIRYDAQPFSQKLTRLERVELDNRDLKARVNQLEKRMENYDIQFARIDETYHQVRVMQTQVNGFEVAVSERIGDLFTRALRQGLGKFIAPAKEMFPQPPDLSIDCLLEAKREAKEAKEAERRANKEAKEKAKKEVREVRQRAKREAEEAKKARKAEAVAKKEAELATKERVKREAEEAKERAKREAEEVAQRAEGATTKAQEQQQSFGENPLATTITRLKEG